MHYSNFVRAGILSCEDQVFGIKSEKVKKPQKICNGFGEWEKYTRGIGGKVMMSLGYELGKGLGRELQGDPRLVNEAYIIESYLRKDRSDWVLSADFGVMDYYLSLGKQYEDESDSEEDSDYSDYEDYEDYDDDVDSEDDFDEEADLLSRAMDHDDSDRYMYMDMYTRKYIDGDETSDESEDDVDEGTLKSFMQLRTLLRRAGEYTGYFTSKIDKMKMKLRSHMQHDEKDVEEGCDCLEEEFENLGLEEEGESDDEEHVSDNDLDEMNAFSELKSTSRFMKHWSNNASSKLKPLTKLGTMYQCKPSCLLSGYPHELCMGFSGPRARPWA